MSLQPAPAAHAGCHLQEELQGSPPANPELMNPRNLLPVNSLFFGVLVRTMGIRAWQAGCLLPRAQFSSQEKSELGPHNSPVSFPICNNPLFLHEALSV